MLIRSFIKGILLVPSWLISCFGCGLGAPQRLGGAEWGFAQEGNTMHELLDGCVLLTIINSVWTSSISLKNAKSLVHDTCTWGCCLKQISFSKSNQLRADFLLRHMELTKDNRDHARQAYYKNWLFIFWYWEEGRSIWAWVFFHFSPSYTSIFILSYDSNVQYKLSLLAFRNVPHA